MPKRKGSTVESSSSGPAQKVQTAEPSTAASAAPQTPTDVTLFKDILKIKSGDNYQARFAAIADYLLNHTVFLAGTQAYRLAEIEFYMVGEGHDDCYTHKHPEQKLMASWYFHRVVPGIDLTFGGGPVQFGGILLRSLEDLKDHSIIEGTGLIQGLACRNNGCASKEKLTELLAAGLPATDDVLTWSPAEVAKPSSAVEDTPAAGGRTARVLPKKAQAQLVLIHDRAHILEEKKLTSCPRVSLGVKNVPGVDKYRFLMSHYRFLTDVRDIKTGKPNIVLGLRAKGWTAQTIADATGCKLETVKKYIELLKNTKSKSLEQFAPCRSLVLEDYCALYQLIHKLP